MATGASRLRSRPAAADSGVVFSVGGADIARRLARGRRDATAHAARSRRGERFDGRASAGGLCRARRRQCSGRGRGRRNPGHGRVGARPLSPRSTRRGSLRSRRRAPVCASSSPCASRDGAGWAELTPAASRPAARRGDCFRRPHRTPAPRAGPHARELPSRTRARAQLRFSARRRAPVAGRPGARRLVGQHGGARRRHPCSIRRVCVSPTNSCATRCSTSSAISRLPARRIIGAFRSYRGGHALNLALIEAAMRAGRLCIGAGDGRCAEDGGSRIPSP